MRLHAALVLIAVCFVGSPVLAEPPPGTEVSPSLRAWFHDLRVPDTGSLCCDVADCRNVRAEIRGDGHWWAYVDSATFPDDAENQWHGHAPNRWVQVPDSRIIKRLDNPTGEAVLCWYAGEIRCFVAGAGT